MDVLGTQVSSDESERLIKMEETLHQRVIGQEEAVVAISRAIRRARVGLKNPNRPIASFIFSGAPLHQLPLSLAMWTACAEEAYLQRASRTCAVKSALASALTLATCRGPI